jgi:CheY-like chemotaxis protein
MSRILIVDDNPTNREIIRETLRVQEYEFDEATDGFDAVEKATANVPDLILMDISMPRLDGVSALHALKANKRTSAVPVVMVTASSADDYMAKCFDEGARDYIVPPFSEIVFRARVNAALRNGHDDPHVTTAAKSQPTKRCRGKILGVLGAKGGVGASTVGISFVAQLVGRGERQVGLIELASATNGLASQLGMVSTASFDPLLKGKTSSINNDLFETACLRHPAGFKVLFAPSAKGVSSELRPSFVKTIVSTASRLWSYSVLDMPTIPTAGMRKAATMCDQLVLVTEPDRVSMAAAKMWLDRLLEWEVRRGDISVVIVNKNHDQESLTLDEMRSELGFPIIANIKPDPGAELLTSRLAKLSARGESKLEIVHRS